VARRLHIHAERHRYRTGGVIKTLSTQVQQI
jgi:hypothetical protein